MGKLAWWFFINCDQAIMGMATDTATIRTRDTVMDMAMATAMDMGINMVETLATATTMAQILQVAISFNVDI